MQQPRRVIFDFDGTVANTMPPLEMIATRIIQAIYSLGETDALRGYRQTIGASFEEQLDELFPRHTGNENAAHLFGMQREAVYDISPPKAGAVETIKALSESGVQSYIVSSTPWDLVDRWLERHLPFGNIFTLAETHGGMKQQQVSSAVRGKVGLTVMIGDAPRDMRYAQYENIPFLGVIGTFSKDEWAAGSPAPVFNNINQAVRHAFA